MENETAREHELPYCKTCFEGRLWGKKDINEGVNMNNMAAQGLVKTKYTSS